MDEVVASKDLVLVIDRMPLRRAQLVRFLEVWANRHDLRISASSISEVAHRGRIGSCRIQLLSVCAEELADAQIVAAFRVMRAAYPDAPIVVLDHADHIDSVRFAFRIGAASYIPSSLEADVALAALSFVLSGGSYFPLSVLQTLREFSPSQPGPQAIGKLAFEPAGGPEAGTEQADHGGSGRLMVSEEPDDEAVKEIGDLTLRQNQVLERLPLGQSNKEIARALGMSEATVKVHVRQVMKRLGVANRTQAAVVAMKLRLTIPAQRPSPQP